MVLPIDVSKIMGRRSASPSTSDSGSRLRLTPVSGDRSYSHYHSAEGADLTADNLEAVLEAGKRKSKHKSKKKVWRHRAKLILPHVGLVVLSVFYTVLGGAMFYFIESPNEANKKQIGLFEIQRIQDNITTNFLSIARAQLTDGEIEGNVTAGLGEFMDVIFDVYSQYFVTKEDLRRNVTASKWTFPASLFFSATVITTIGYGHLVPNTTLGQVMCVLFALFGIPLILVTVADMGKFLSEYVSSVWDRYIGCVQWVITRSFRAVMRKLHVPEFMYAQQGSALAAAAAGGRAGSTGTGTGDSFKLFDMEEPQIPVVFIFIVWLAYTAIGGLILRLWEDWTFFESFYYCFITVTTIGFGDIIPEKNSHMGMTLLYIVTGLIITTMCIDLVGTQYIRKIHFLGRNIRNARVTLAQMGDRVVHIGEVIRYIAHLQRDYGFTSEEIERLGAVPEEFLLRWIMSGKPLPPHLRHLFSTPYIPRDFRLWKWIDSRNTNSWRSDGIVSVDSFELHSVVSQPTSRRPSDSLSVVPRPKSGPMERMKSFRRTKSAKAGDR